MGVANTEKSWGWPARVIHWVMALMIFGLLGIGIYMAEFEKDIFRQYELVQMHKSFGFTVFVLAVIRVVWRLVNPSTPRLPQTMPRWQITASHASHVALYVLIVAMPISGWLMASSSPLNDEGAYPIQIRNMVFGLFEMPDPYPQGSETLTNLFNLAHTSMAYLMIAILVVHMGAALKHHFVDRDTILRRMITGA